jgi:hypothetical protein
MLRCSCGSVAVRPRFRAIFTVLVAPKAFGSCVRQVQQIGHGALDKFISQAAAGPSQNGVAPLRDEVFQLLRGPQRAPGSRFGVARCVVVECQPHAATAI